MATAQPGTSRQVGYLRNLVLHPNGAWSYLGAAFSAFCSPVQYVKVVESWPQKLEPVYAVSGEEMGTDRGIYSFPLTIQEDSDPTSRNVVLTSHRIFLAGPNGRFRIRGFKIRTSEYYGTGDVTITVKLSVDDSSYYTKDITTASSAAVWYPTPNLVGNYLRYEISTSTSSSTFFKFFGIEIDWEPLGGAKGYASLGGTMVPSSGGGPVE